MAKHKDKKEELRRQLSNTTHEILTENKNIE